MHLIDAHRRLLLGAETQAEMLDKNQEWGKVFAHWAVRSRDRYSHIVEHNSGTVAEQMVARITKYSAFVKVSP